MGQEQLEFKLKKLFIVAKSLEIHVGQYDFDDLFYVLLDEVEQVKQLYDENAQEQIEA